MNFKDVMLAYGKLDRNLMAKGFFQGCLGFEFSGTSPVKAGRLGSKAPRRVMGVARRALATQVCTTENLVSRHFVIAYLLALSVLWSIVCCFSKVA